MLRIINLFLFCIIISSSYSVPISERKIERIENNEELISSIMSECFGPQNTMICLKEKVLTYLDTIIGLKQEESRLFSRENIDESIFNRVARILSNNEIKIQLPETLFDGIVLKYNPINGVDIDAQAVEGIYFVWIIISKS